MNNLELHTTNINDDLAWPVSLHDLTERSSAMLFFHDFETFQPNVINSDVPALEAKRQMRNSHIDTELVLNSKGEFVGIISKDDLIERKIVQKVSEGNKRDEISVSELMTPKRNLKAFNYSDVSNAKIADIINQLKDNGEQHSLVVDETSHKIRGVFSTNDISKKLHKAIEVKDKKRFYHAMTATA